MNESSANGKAVAGAVGVGPARFLPPPGFPVYAVVDSWAGVPCLDFLEILRAGRSAPPAPVGIWLAHRTLDLARGVRIGSFSEDYSCGHDEPLRPIALRLADIVSDLAIPGRHDIRPGGFDMSRLIKVQVEYCRNSALNYSEWSRTTFEVDGVPYPVRYWQFAGVWGGFTQSIGGVYVLAVGVGVAPGVLRLARVRSGARFGLDLDKPLDRFFAKGQSRDWYETVLRKPNLYACHPDQLALLNA